jgi:imidazoleglycerol-phosphate dehydratase
MNDQRRASVERSTSETRVMVKINLDGQGRHQIKTGVGFFDHMLAQVARHGRMDLEIDATGDLWIDAHHTVEDVGLALGSALDQALGERRGIVRYGQNLLPMDETLAMVALDISGRPFARLAAQFPCERVGNMETELVAEFLKALACTARLTLHVQLLAGENCHHMIEAIFKGLGRALCQAVALEAGSTEIPSTKGVL